MKIGWLIYAIGVAIFLIIYGRRIVLDWMEELAWKKTGNESSTDTIWKVLLDRQIGLAIIAGLLSWLSLIALVILFGGEKLKKKKLANGNNL